MINNAYYIIYLTISINQLIVLISILYFISKLYYKRMETDLEFFDRLMKEKAIQDMLKEKEKDDENDHKIIELIASNDKIEEVKSKQTQISKRSNKPITNIKLRMIFE